MQLLLAAWLLIVLLYVHCTNGNADAGRVRALATKRAGQRLPLDGGMHNVEEEIAQSPLRRLGLSLRGGGKSRSPSMSQGRQRQYTSGRKQGGNGKAKKKEKKKKELPKPSRSVPTLHQRSKERYIHDSKKDASIPLEDPSRPLFEDDSNSVDNAEDNDDDVNLLNHSTDSDLNVARLDGKAAAIRSMFTGFFSKTPPMTLMYLTSSIALTTLCFFFNQNYWPEFLTFSWTGLASLQPWRLITGFLYLGGLDLFYPLTLQFVWQHMSYLEKMNYKAPEDFLVLVLFGMASLIGVYSFLGISMRYLGHNLATYLVYIWSKVLEGMDVNFMDLFLLKAELLPWFFCIQTYILEQQMPWADLIGIVVGHGYWYLRQKRLLVAPASWKAYFRRPFWQQYYLQYKAEFE